MKAMIFAAGLGTRLKPLTDVMPKALVEVANKPLLAHTIERLMAAGFDDIVINVHHFSSQIIDYVATHDFGCRIQISDETEGLLDTGGGLKKAASLLGEDENPVLIHNVDIISNIDLNKFYIRNQKEQAVLLVSNRKSSRNLLFNDENELVGWTNLNTGEVKTPYPDLDVAACRHYAFSGIHLLSPSLFQLMASFPDKFSIIDFYLKVCDKVKIKADVCNDLRLLDVGKQDTLQAAEDFLNDLKKRELV